LNIYTNFLNLTTIGKNLLNSVDRSTDTISSKYNLAKKFMARSSWLLACLMVIPLGVIVPKPGSSLDASSLTKNFTTDVLKKLGYDCVNASVGGIVCTKCDDGKCVAYICDSVSRKCRKKNAEIPKKPDLEDINPGELLR
jgi:hypothetical protein